MSSTLGASLLRTVLSDGTLKILGSGLDKGPIIFVNFQNEQAEVNRQLIELLKAIYTQSRIGTNITARMYTTAFPDVARDEIKKVKDKFLGGENNA